MITWDLGHVLPLVSATVWLLLGLGAFGRYGLTSPFVRGLSAFCVLLSAWALTDWYFLTLTDPLQKSLAIFVSNVKASLLALVSLAILLSSKWISRGHSRYDVLLVLPPLGSIAVVWTGMTYDANAMVWGFQLLRYPFQYSLYVLQLLAYFALSIAFAISLALGRRDLPSRLRTPALLSIGGLVLFVALWLTTNVLTNLTLSPGQPIFSAVLFVPGLFSVVAFSGRSVAEMGEIFRAVSDVERRVIGLYVFYRSGEPLVAIGAARTLPIEAEQLQGILDLVGNFVETSMRKFRGYAVTSMHFDRLGILAVRGQFVIVAAVFEGAAYDALRSELLRSMHAFEQSHHAELQTWEAAAIIADAIADDLAALVRRPSFRPTTESHTDG
ncbi:MAG TPA: hypothetical protein VEY12_01595 [Thermoplasmata archaeon]|nr:hypothetical protein [Thermoplasmata archaeon]